MLQIHIRLINSVSLLRISTCLGTEKIKKDISMLILLPSQCCAPFTFNAMGTDFCHCQKNHSDFLESHVGNDALLVAVLILEKRRNHKRQNQVSKDCHELQP
jgi:hypothetical protein